MWTSFPLSFTRLALRQPMITSLTVYPGARMRQLLLRLYQVLPKQAIIVMHRTSLAQSLAVVRALPSRDSSNGSSEETRRTTRPIHVCIINLKSLNINVMTVYQRKDRISRSKANL
mmetsp:Transcript_32124/g.44024  ORF Transcript_32124/g.44024 Transcript_32124/m.44024 type:complete len:116 (+) Transcript_32124:2196-2543(+)